MNFSIYPVNDSEFYNTGNKTIGESPTNKCLETQGYSPSKCKIDLSSGYHKPLNELCKEIHYSIAEKNPKDICTDSPWNNMTRRISLVKDY